MIHVGVCGFPASRDTLFSSLEVIEIQKTFYDLLSEKSLRRLFSGAPPGFLFTLKAFQGITHPASSPTYRRTQLPEHFEASHLGFFQPTQEVEESARITLHSAELINARVIVFQCPPSFQPTPSNLENFYRFFTHFNRGSLLFAFEPRGKWPEETVRKVCEDLRLIHVVDPFFGDPTTPSPYYFRLHGRGKYHYRYTREEMENLATKLEHFTGEVFCLFNNTAMFENAQELKGILKGSSP